MGLFLFLNPSESLVPERPVISIWQLGVYCAPGKSAAFYI
jgi:hypothetical protein